MNPTGPESLPSDATHPAVQASESAVSQVSQPPDVGCRQEAAAKTISTAPYSPRSEKCLWWFLGISAWFLLTFFHQRNFDGPTPVSRLDLIMAICLERRLEIDSFHKNTPDKAFVNGHYYSDKAPGTVAASLIGAAPAIWLGRHFGLTSNDKQLWLLASWSGCGVLNIILAGGFVCLLRLLWDILHTSPNPTGNHNAAVRVFGVFRGFSLITPRFLRSLLSEGTPSRSSVSNCRTSFRIALATTIFIIFGGMAWPYATMMFSHAQTIGCIAIGLWSLHRSDPTLFTLSPLTTQDPALSLRASQFRLLFLSGFSFGWALNSEYTTGLIVLGIPLTAFWSRGSKTKSEFSILLSALKWFPFLLGLTGPCLLIPLYSWTTIGIPWQLPYSYQAEFPEMRKGLYAIQWPNLEIAWKLLFSTERGLIFWSPFLATALLGYTHCFRNGRLFLITYALPLVQLIVISGRTWDWPAGHSFSARYLSPIIPLLAIPCALTFRNMRTVGAALGWVSLVLITSITVTDATPSFKEHRNPFLTLTLPLLYQLDFNQNIVGKLVLANEVGTIVFALLAFMLLWSLPLCLLKRIERLR